MYFRIKTSTSAAAFWLFLLIFNGMQQNNRCRTDFCYAAALLMQHEATSMPHDAVFKDDGSINSNITLPSPENALPPSYPSPSPTSHRVASLTTIANTKRTINAKQTRDVVKVQTVSVVKNEKNLNNFKENENIFNNERSTDAVNFANDAPVVSASGRAPLAWDDPELLLGRRHIIPEKLQYTPEISVKQGRLVGIIRRMQLQTGLRDVEQYLGLPYAEAPVGSRRFMPPGAPLPWQGLKMARHLPPVCPQKLPDLSVQGTAKMSPGRLKQLTRLLPYLKNESEDCLYLNLYVPRHGDGLGATQLLPVLVYVHGESFEWNSGNPYDGSVLASYGGVIVVTVNYRLGILGFLKPGLNGNTVANFGLLDQIAALHWIKENIGFFGGDRESVTLMGHNTGAACVNYLMVSPVASGLFHRAILMSGSAMSDWAASNHSLQLTMQIAHNLDCPLNDDNEEMLECLRGKRYQDIMKISTAFPQFSTSLGPIVDGHVIPNQPYKVMGQFTELFSRYDLLFGITESESYHTLGALALEQGLRENERDNLLRFYMQSRFDVRPDLALAATMKKYTDMYNNPIKATNMEHRDLVLDILSDARIVGPLMQTGLFHADVNPDNYMYVFGHNSAAGPHASLPYSTAGEELAFIFGAPLAPAGPFHHSYSAQEKLLSEAVMAYWTNFAKTGNPKAPWKGTFINLHALEWDRYDLDWPEFNKRTQAYINIGIPPSIGYKYRQIYMNFWNKALPDELNQIAEIQQQPQLHIYSNGNMQLPRGGTANGGGARLGGDVITGHMSKYGHRFDGAEDPVRTLKLLLQEPYGNPAKSTTNPELAENMYNAPPTFGVAKKTDDSSGTSTWVTSATNFELATTQLPTKPALVPPDESPEPEQVARSETTMQLLIALITLFIVLNVIIYGTFLLQKRRKKQVKFTRKLGVGGTAAGILSYDGTTDDELKRSKHTTHDGDDSYVLDVVRKSNTYEAVKTQRSPINGYKMARQLSCSTVDTHTKVCEWMAGGGASIEAVALHDGGSSSGGGSFQRQSQQISVAIDATSDARGRIVCQEVQVDPALLTPQSTLDECYTLMRQHSAATEACDCVLPLQEEAEDEQVERLHFTHAHSRSDPVDMQLYQRHLDEQVTSFMHVNAAYTPDFNVTSRDDEFMVAPPLSAAAQLRVIKRRNYPKVLPTGQVPGGDSPPMTVDLRSCARLKRNSLPPNAFVLQQSGVKLQQPPLPPPRSISTLGRKQSLRRCSGGGAMSPAVLAQDSSVDEEPPQITQNTLIVGPIVPKCDMATLRRNNNRREQDQQQQQPDVAHNADTTTVANEQEHSQHNQQQHQTQALHQNEHHHHYHPQQHQHHTEAIYAISPSNINTTATTPITPTSPLSPANFSTATCSGGVIYAQPNKSATKGQLTAGKSQIPRMLLPATDIDNTNTATMLPTTTAVTTTRIPQFHRRPNTFQQQQHEQQSLQHTNVCQSSAAGAVEKTTAPTSSSSTAAFFANPVTTSFAANQQQQEPSTLHKADSTSNYSSCPVTTSSLRDSLSSSNSSRSGSNCSNSSSSSISSSTSSTGTVRTELKQKPT